ncbi:hypothetical protein EJ04DRAFT_481332 [Polyplosphaeria fusca]|uniref:Zn(2)-C6 fungal-type domain-containing protein n=1 Tax=Polyplosphaeria fusca TaxID=682080 RepID=A0A9P4V7K9_9PLEO|nr:hypothetical protein EJ04DRAFT_481332 [Polyplosphaeria fusca]
MAMSSSATQAVEAQKPETTPNNASAAPRKRRRRAPATGASEDCFACKKRQIKCDRRRPYCGQCVEIGKECSGYRTTLTWGVGVASRGKLRGLSLPIAKSPTQTTSTSKESTTAAQTSPTARSPPTGPAQGPTKLEARGSIDYGVHSPTSPTSPNMYSAPHEYLHLGPTSPIPIPSPTTPMGFAVPGYREHVDPFHPHSSKLRRSSHIHRGPLQRLHTTLGVPSFEDSGLSASTASLGTYSDSDYPSPGEFPHTPDDFPFMESSVPQYSSLIFHDQTPMSSTENFHLHFYEAPRSLPIADDVSSSISSDQSVQDFNEVNSGQCMGPSVFPDVFMEGDMNSSVHGPSQPGFAYLPTEGMSSIGSGVPLSNEPTLTFSIPQTPFIDSPLSLRMRSLLDYYDRFICPAVASDSPANPYRIHILRLAMRNEGLQSAIAALATNNMRMRGGIEGRRLSLPQNSKLLPDHAFSQMTARELREMHGEPTSEEQHYKQTSIAILNRQLADQSSARDDSVLATLLVLCLYHVCDSGFTKFKTQLAGVQKLLSMRDRSVQSNFIGWIELFFTWFDVMTSTVNDRETQVQGESLDMMNLTANLGALEHLTGCEGRLFKLIARLGRLNVLSQNRPVRESSITPRASPQPKRQRDFYSFNFDRIDGNGWGTPVQDPTSPVTPTADDPRPMFWMEWNDIRTRLQEWEIDAEGALHADSSTLAMSPEQAALLHISESFRYAALLYTERLAHPAPPSRSVNFQSLVAQGLFHVSQIGITSCFNKFLLWPLFVIGTECVDPEHRAIVRQRCVEIQRESGFFNNLSSLEVLEKVWQEDDERGDDGEAQPGGQGPLGAQQQAFRWRNAMDRVDGEYIVI